MSTSTGLSIMFEALCSR